MKRIVSSILVFCMALSLAGCGKTQAVTYTCEMERSGLMITDTMSLEAKGDKVQNITETIEIDMSAFDDEQQSMLIEDYDKMVEQYNSVKGVEAEGTAEGSSYTLSVAIQAKKSTVSALSEQDLLEIKGDSGGISLKATTGSLEANGYTLVE